MAVGAVLVAALVLAGCAPDDGARARPVDRERACGAEPPPFRLSPAMDAPRANRSLAFFEDALVGWDEHSLLRATSPTRASVFVPNVTAFGGMTFLPDGDLVVSEHLGSENLLEITPAGGTRILAAGLRAYGVVLGPDGAVYATSEHDAIYRIDPSDDSLETFVAFAPEVLPRVADFSPEGDRLYVGTRSEEGLVWVIDLDADLRPVGEPRVFAETPGTFHDVLVVDACGDLYVTAFYDTALYRISPEGEVVTVARMSAEEHLHGAAWGSGVGSWSDHSLYFSLPNRGSVVREWALGIPGRAGASGAR